MTDFKLSCCKLFEQFPLYNYRTPTTDSPNQKLYILLIGYGKRMDTILREVLTNGQLLSTDLDICVANTNAKGTCETLLKKAPYLGHFAHILTDFTTISEPKAADRLCTLHFNNVQLTPDAMSKVLETHNEYSYVIISTGNDEKNRALAQACAQFSTNHKTLITYVQKRNSDDVEIISPFSEVYPFTSTKEDTYRQQIERIALNLHYIYAKFQNERASYDEILKEFQDPYTYISNVEAALHIRSKLACCGIYDNDLNIASAKFSKLLSSKPEVIEQLSVLEHQRWVMSKLLDGYRQLERIDFIYRNGATTHSNVDKWHCCLVSCNPSGNSKLTNEDWENASNILRCDLDDLDKISLQIHKQCRIISEATSGQVDSILQTIRNSLINSSDFSSRTLQIEEAMERAILQMRQHKQSALSLYRTAWGSLNKQIAKEGGILSSMLLNNLSSLDNAISPLVEFVSRKDYKKQDRILVQQIPFALTHKLQPTLLKVLSDKDTENLFSLWQMEPRKIIFFSLAFSLTELIQIKTQTENINRFLKPLDNNISVSYAICVPDSVLNEENGIGAIFENCNCQLLNITDWTIDTVSKALNPIVHAAKADYFDITGGDPLLTRAIEICTSNLNVASFYVKNGQMHSLSGARELEYLAPIKSFTVKEMFELSGAVLKKSESQKLSDLSSKYQELWKIQNKYHTDWSSFCNAVSTAYSNTPKRIGSFTFGYPCHDTATPPKRQIKGVSSVAVANIMPELRRMEYFEYISNVSSLKELGDHYTISFTADPKFAPPQNLEAYLRKCLFNYQPGHSYSFVKGNKEIVCTELQVTGMPTKKVCKNGYERRYYKILTDLSKNGFITNYTYNQEKNICQFQFASKDVLSVLQTSGTALEYMIYYSALYDAHFNDVDMGFEFIHSTTENAAENEIDVICTKGSSSLFISAKLRGKDELEEIFNYVLYEISLLAKQFGVNAKPILAAPALDQFQIDQNGNRRYSSKVTHALKRGVYLLGRECFTSGALGRVLDNIMDNKENWCDFL